MDWATFLSYVVNADLCSSEVCTAPWQSKKSSALLIWQVDLKKKCNQLDIWILGIRETSAHQVLSR